MSHQGPYRVEAEFTGFGGVSETFSSGGFSTPEAARDAAFANDFGTTYEMKSWVVYDVFDNVVIKGWHFDHLCMVLGAKVTQEMAYDYRESIWTNPISWIFFFLYPVYYLLGLVVKKNFDFFSNQSWFINGLIWAFLFFSNDCKNQDNLALRTKLKARNQFQQV